MSQICHIRNHIYCKGMNAQALQRMLLGVFQTYIHGRQLVEIASFEEGLQLIQKRPRLASDAYAESQINEWCCISHSSGPIML